MLTREEVLIRGGFTRSEMKTASLRIKFSLMDNVSLGVKFSRALGKGDALLVPQRRKGRSGL